MSASRETPCGRCEQWAGLTPSWRSPDGEGAESCRPWPSPGPAAQPVSLVFTPWSWFLCPPGLQCFLTPGAPCPPPPVRAPTQKLGTRDSVSFRQVCGEENLIPKVDSLENKRIRFRTQVRDLDCGLCAFSKTNLDGLWRNRYAGSLKISIDTTRSQNVVSLL